MGRFASIFAVVATAGLAWFRLAPTEPAVWHVDPLRAPVPAGSGWLLRSGDGNGDAQRFSQPPGEVLAALDDIALATPRTDRVAGSTGTGRLTYVTRSLVFGFPDYTTVQAAPAEGGTELTVFARQRFGAKDMGVNRKRVEDWMARLRKRLG
ncbi:DUF1499 domain-containing protein [Tranquillimonas alkanivorans]|uniref:DUF1499 domain-containing protein n=1 Tax=Tranquillimonas alkanivorans TaxID=441119 RepID=A0A1I5QMC5_9RHOB|nr:DUF1499 domain-containing protein [Tranquillimonas alkanivorans]SFP47419.1 Protein of unknown function [Tranquillimonas alkanivorans]